MPNLDRRNLLHAGIALAAPIGGISLLFGDQQTTSSPHNHNSQDERENQEPDEKEKPMQIQYLEIVTAEVDALCKQYSAVYGITFGEPVAELGNARTAKLNSGGLVGIRGPLRDTETPVIRPYVLVENLKEAVAAAADAGAEIAIPSMKIPGQGTIAVVIQGGIESGLWQLSK